MPPGDAELCRSCNGSGHLEPDPPGSRPIDPCPDCNGWGEIREDDVA